ncbi:LAGLIDADG homing endonuclease (mitochondrion) [Pyrrhoderma noxium]|uniref:LAGLIDADG homing endonuclease n=1 Tax=Pyrrhoderma noxium TaxID=2282107 RepID=A0A541AXL9_9AGAM|nr:LAGLIDADG homing endonuclease [Pyrrhoderma noxium]
MKYPAYSHWWKVSKINKRNSGKITKSNPFLTLLLVLILFSLYNISDSDAVIVSSILSVTGPPEIFNLNSSPKMTPDQKYKLKRKAQKWNKVSTCKDIVVYGSNLSSGVGSAKQLSKHVYYMYGLPSFQLEVLIGLLLSDGWLIIDKKYRSVNARFGLKQSIINFPLLWYVFSIISHYCRNLPHVSSNVEVNYLTV